MRWINRNLTITAAAPVLTSKLLSLALILIINTPPTKINVVSSCRYQTPTCTLDTSKHSESSERELISSNTQQLINDVNAKRKRDTTLISGNYVAIIITQLLCSPHNRVQKGTRQEHKTYSRSYGGNHSSGVRNFQRYSGLKTSGGFCCFG